MSETLADHLLHQLVVGDAAAIAALVERSRTSEEPIVLVAAALFAADDRDGLLDRAAAKASSSRDRQLVAIAAAHAGGRRELVDALARDHLVDHPDSVLVAWIAAASRRTAAPHDPTPDPRS